MCRDDPIGGSVEEGTLPNDRTFLDLNIFKGDDRMMFQALLGDKIR